MFLHIISLFLIVNHTCSLKTLFKGITIAAFHHSLFFFIQGNLELNDSCEITEQCKQPLSVCFQGKCKCIKGYSAFDIDSCIKGL